MGPTPQGQMLVTMGATLGPPCRSRAITLGPSTRGLALQGWERPKVSEMPVPWERWEEVHKKNQRKFNGQLALGIAIFGFTLYKLYQNFLGLGLPCKAALEKCPISAAELPWGVKQQYAEMQSEGVAKTFVGIEGIKDPPATVKIIEEIIEIGYEVKDAAGAVVSAMEKAVDNNKKASGERPVQA